MILLAFRSVFLYRAHALVRLHRMGRYCDRIILNLKCTQLLHSKNEFNRAIGLIKIKREFASVFHVYSLFSQNRLEEYTFL